MSRTERLTEGEARIVAAAEADLQRLLSIDPSPEFASRVRSRIDQNRRTHTTVWAWVGVGLAAAATVVLLVALRTDRSSPAPQPVTATHADIPLRPPATPAEKLSPPSLAAAKPVVSQRRSEGSAKGPATPEVIIDAAMKAAIQRMTISLRNTSPDVSVAESLQVEEGHPAALKIAEPLNVPELVLKPAEENGGDQNLFEQHE